MTSSYHGIFVQKLSDGTIISVRVKDNADGLYDFTIDEYRRQGILPLAETLPDLHESKPDT